MRSRTLSNIALAVSALVLLIAAAGGGYLSWRWLNHSSSTNAASGVDSAAYAALKGEGIELMSGGRVAILAEPSTS